MSSSSSADCDLGAILKDNVCLTADSINFRDLDDEQKEILKLRTGCNAQVSSVCQSHWAKYFELYEAHQRYCADPFGLHKKKVKRGLRNISIDQARLHHGLQLIPGKKLCSTCRTKVSKHQGPSAEISEPTPTKTSTSSSEGM